MTQLNKSELLQANIAILEARQKLEFKTMKSQLHITYASLHPIHIIKDLVQNISAKQSNTYEAIGESAIGIVSSYVSNKMVESASKKVYKNSIGSVVQLLIAKSIAQNKSIINKGVALLFQCIIDRKKRLN